MSKHRFKNILCHNNIAAGMVPCRSMLSILMASCYKQPICVDDTAIIMRRLISAVSQYNIYGA